MINGGTCDTWFVKEKRVACQQFLEKLCCFKLLSTEIYFSGGGVGMRSWSAARTCYFEGVMFIALSSSTRYKILHKAKASKTKHVVLGNFCSPLDSPRPKNASSNSLFMNGMQIKCHENFRETLFSQKWSKRINLLA